MPTDTLAHPLDAYGHARLRTSLTRRSVTRGSDGSIGFKGTAILFNTRTWIGSKDWGFWEQIDPAAVTKTLQEADVRLLQNHDPNYLLARSKAGTLRMTAGPDGLEVDADMAPTSYAEDLAVLLDRGDISQMSFAFQPISWRTEEAEDGKELITVTELRLSDVSVVTYPAYEDTDAGLRAAAFDQLCRSAELDPALTLRRYIADERADLLHDVEERAEEPGETTPPETAATEDSAPGETTRSDTEADEVEPRANRTALLALATRTKTIGVTP